MDIEKAKIEIDLLNERISKLKAERFKLSKELALFESMEFIRVNGITKRDVHRPDDSEVAFLYAEQFRVWVESQEPKRRFCEWNGNLIFTADFLSRRISHTPARIEDVPD